MRLVILLLCILALTAILLLAVYQTDLGMLVGGWIPDGFWVWLHSGAAESGAESAYDLEWLVFALQSGIVSTVTVLLVDRWLRRFR